jgi:hypothetical protein
MPELAVVCFKWKQRGYHTTFHAAHVNVLRRMVARHYSKPHRFVCITDDPAGVECETAPLWPDHGALQNVCGSYLPSCYRRLRLFARDMTWLGARIVSIDLDCVVVGGLAPLWDRDESFVAWSARGTHHPVVVNGSMFMLRAGAHPDVWEEFDPAKSPAEARGAGYLGSDQAWLGYRFRGCPSWSAADGVLSFQRDLKHRRRLPSGARVVFFHGRENPWDAEVQTAHPWISEHWR